MIAAEHIAHGVSPADLSYEANGRAAARKSAVRILVLSEIRVFRSDADVGGEHQLMGQIPGIAVRDYDNGF